LDRGEEVNTEILIAYFKYHQIISIPNKPASLLVVETLPNNPIWKKKKKKTTSLKRKRIKEEERGWRIVPLCVRWFLIEANTQH
jgi:hypothetical protein